MENLKFPYGDEILRTEEMRVIGKKLRDFLDVERKSENRVKINGVSFDGTSFKGLGMLMNLIDETKADQRVGFLGLDVKFQAAMRNSKLATKGACNEIVLTPLYYSLRAYIKASPLLPSEAAEAFRA